MEPKFFATPKHFRAWLEKNHDKTTELIVGFHKKGSGKPSITWPESVDAALCFGWIDGVRRTIDADSYTIRFTPRKPRSIWSAINVKRVEEMTRLGMMHAAGLKAFERLEPNRSQIYAYEQRNSAKLSSEQERQFRGTPGALEFFRQQPPWYQRTATYWVLSAKKEETRQKRLAELIEDSGNGRTIRPLRRPGTAK
jgi:uncharacterized protein YdeI (YjbR/CyaY-like superfamily)